MWIISSSVVAPEKKRKHLYTYMWFVRFLFGHCFCVNRKWTAPNNQIDDRFIVSTMKIFMHFAHRTQEQTLLLIVYLVSTNTGRTRSPPLSYTNRFDFWAPSIRTFDTHNNYRKKSRNIVCTFIIKTIQLIFRGGSQAEDIIYIFHVEYLRDSLHLQSKVKLSLWRAHRVENSIPVNWKSTDSRMSGRTWNLHGNMVNHLIVFAVVWLLLGVRKY